MQLIRIISGVLCNIILYLIVDMGDSRICSRGFPEVVIHSALARRKFFIITTPTFHVNFFFAFVLIIIHVAKDSPKVVLYENLYSPSHKLD